MEGLGARGDAHAARADNAPSVDARDRREALRGDRPTSSAKASSMADHANAEAQAVTKVSNADEELAADASRVEHAVLARQEAQAANAALEVKVAKVAQAAQDALEAHDEKDAEADKKAKMAQEAIRRGAEDATGAVPQTERAVAAAVSTERGTGREMATAPGSAGDDLLGDDTIRSKTTLEQKRLRAGGRQTLRERLIEVAKEQVPVLGGWVKKRSKSEGAGGAKGAGKGATETEGRVTKKDARDTDQGNVVFQWTYGGNSVQVMGSFDDWSMGIYMQPNADGIPEARLHAAPGTEIEYKFVVDGEWVVDLSKPIVGTGDEANNVLVATKKASGASGEAAASASGATMSPGVELRWPYGGANVHLMGSFDGWTSGIPCDAEGVARLPPIPRGTTIQYKWVVDGRWLIDLAAPIAGHGDGANNLLTLG